MRCYFTKKTESQFVIFVFLVICFLQTSLVYANSFNDFLYLERNTKKVTLNFANSQDCHGYCAPTDGFELNRAVDELESDHAISYETTNQASISKLIGILNNSVIKTPSSENPQLIYVNFLITFELKDRTKSQLLIGKYYEADPTIEVELRRDKKQVNTWMLDKMAHKTLRDWILQYARVDNEAAFKRFQNACQYTYSRRIKNYEDSEVEQNKLFLERGQVRPSGIGSTRDILNEGYKAKLAKCNDPDNPDYLENLKYFRHMMLRNYFKSDANQICERHDLYHTDPNYCAAWGEWQPSYNQWNVNNIEEKSKWRK